SVEAISDALRFEVKGFGVDVVLVEPGLIVTRFGEAAAATIEPGGDGEAAQTYAEFNEMVGKTTKGAYDGPMAKLGAGPEAVAKVIEKAISRRRPKPRYPVTASARILLAQRRIVTDRMWDTM